MEVKRRSFFSALIAPIVGLFTGDRVEAKMVELRGNGHEFPADVSVAEPSVRDLFTFNGWSAINPRRCYKCGEPHRDAFTLYAFTSVTPPAPPPALGRNVESAFALMPIDETRLAEFIALGKSIGFYPQSMDITRSWDKYAMVTLAFSQGPDPRVKL